MKTIVTNSDNASRYIEEDSQTITLSADNIVIGNPAENTICDLNNTNSTLYTNVTNVPEDWVGKKYLFDGTTWTLNPNWVAKDPDEPDEE
jgi:hypothetical protein